MDAQGARVYDRHFANVNAFKFHMKPLQSSSWVSVEERN